MVHGKNRIPYWIDRRLTGLAGPEYHAIISFGLPLESEDCQYGKSQLQPIREKAPAVTVQTSGDLLDQRHRRQGNLALSKAVSPPSAGIRPLKSEQLPPADAGPPVLNLRPRLRCGRQSYRRRPSLS